MANDGGYIATFNCDCGNSFDEDLAGKDLDTAEFACPSCGEKRKLTPEEIAGVTAIINEAAKKIDDALRQVASKHSWIKYRPN